MSNESKGKPESSPCAGMEYYCAYEEGFGEYHLIAANTQSGYYCGPYEGGDPAQVVPVCLDPSPVSSMVDDDKQVPRRQRYFCEYVYAGGNRFDVVEARCGPEHCCPTDLREYFRQLGRDDVFQELKHLMQTVHHGDNIFRGIVLRPVNMQDDPPRPNHE